MPRRAILIANLVLVTVLSAACLPTRDADGRNGDRDRDTVDVGRDSSGDALANPAEPAVEAVVTAVPLATATPLPTPTDPPTSTPEPFAASGVPVKHGAWSSAMLR